MIVILVIVLLIFGPGKLPELGKAVGDGLRELKKATGNDEHKDTATLPAATAPVAPVAPVAPTPITAAPTVAARTCPSCRGVVPVADKFCGNCGATMEAVTRSA